MPCDCPYQNLLGVSGNSNTSDKNAGYTIFCLLYLGLILYVVWNAHQGVKVNEFIYYLLYFTLILGMIGCFTVKPNMESYEQPGFSSREVPHSQFLKDNDSQKRKNMIDCMVKCPSTWTKLVCQDMCMSTIM